MQVIQGLGWEFVLLGMECVVYDVLFFIKVLDVVCKVQYYILLQYFCLYIFNEDICDILVNVVVLFQDVKNIQVDFCFIVQEFFVCFCILQLKILVEVF